MLALVALVAALHLTPANNHRTFAVKPGTAIVITLPSNASTGYRWFDSLVESSRGSRSVVHFVSRRYVAPSTGRPGAAGKEIWRFRAVGKGKTDLGLRYARPWRPNQIARRFHIRILVR